MWLCMGGWDAEVVGGRWMVEEGRGGVSVYVDG